MSKKPDYKKEKQRWENGVPHHKLSEALMAWMADVDYNTGDTFCLKKGGDGDNGEHLMYLMDGFFERTASVAEDSTPFTDEEIETLIRRAGKITLNHSVPVGERVKMLDLDLALRAISIQRQEQQRLDSIRGKK